MIQLAELYQRLECLTLSDVIGEYTQLRKRGSEWEGLCPFHSDKSIGSFKINDMKNIWKCFSCDVSGFGPVSFYKELFQTSTNSEAAILLARQYNLISQEEANTPLYTAPRIEFQSKKSFKPKREKASIQILDSVYRAFIRSADPLSAAQVRHLAVERKLNDSEFQSFFAFPLPTKKFWNKFREELAKENPHISIEELISHVPGFFYDKTLNKVSFCSYENALGIISYDINGNINGLQIRNPSSDKKKRYVWFSSGFADNSNDDHLTNGTTNSNVVSILPPSGAKRILPTIAITEGIFKAKKITKMGMWTINLYGVSGWKNILDPIHQIEGKSGIKAPKIMIFFDADITTNDSVAKAGRNLANLLIAHQYDVYFAYWPIELGKGVDDFINNGYEDQLCKMQAKKFIRAYLDPVIKKGEKEREIRRMEKEKQIMHKV